MKEQLLNLLNKTVVGVLHAGNMRAVIEGKLHYHETSQRFHIYPDGEKVATLTFCLENVDKIHHNKEIHLSFEQFSNVVGT